MVLEVLFSYYFESRVNKSLRSVKLELVSKKVGLVGGPQTLKKKVQKNEHFKKGHFVEFSFIQCKQNNRLKWQINNLIHSIKVVAHFSGSVFFFSIA